MRMRRLYPALIWAVILTAHLMQSWVKCRCRWECLHESDPMAKTDVSVSLKGSQTLQTMSTSPFSWCSTCHLQQQQQKGTRVVLTWVSLAHAISMHKLNASLSSWRMSFIVYTMR